VGRARKQKHGLPYVTGRGVVVRDEFDETIPRQAKTAMKRHAAKEKGK
jgi:hypothetical protein